MKLVEVVVLLGAHCASPLQQAPAMTEVHKVQCAVIVEKDTANGEVRVMPEEASLAPQVKAAVARHQGAGPAIAPAAAAPPLPQTDTPIAPPPQLPSMAAAPVSPATAPPKPSIVPAWAPPDPGAAQVLRKPLEETNLAPAAEEPAGDAVITEEPDSTAAVEPSEPVAAPAVPAGEADASEEPAAEPKPAKVEAKKASPKKAAQRKPGKTKAKRVAEAKQKATAKRGAQCSGAAKPHWYTAADGRKKYRCRTPTVY